MKYVKPIEEFSKVNENNDPVNEDVMAVMDQAITQVMHLLNDKTTVEVMGELIQKGLMLKVMLGALFGFPTAAALAAKYTKAADAVKSKFKSTDDAIEHIKNAKEGQKIA